MFFIDILFTGFFIYGICNFDNIKTKPFAIENTKKIIYLEKQFNIFIEPKLQSWFISNIGYRFYKLLHIIYHILHMPTAIPLLLYLLVVGDIYNTKYIFYIGTIIGRIINKQFPVLPPRLLHTTNIPETQTLFLKHVELESRINHDMYSSMPSLHTYWAIWVSHTLSIIFDYNYYFYFHLFIVCFTIIITGHHYIIDIIISSFLYFILYTVLLFI